MGVGPEGNVVVPDGDADGEGRNSYCLCGQVKDHCLNPRIVPVMVDDGRWVILPVFCEEMNLIRRMVGLDLLIDCCEFREDVQTAFGLYKCPECEDIFSLEEELVGHLRLEKECLEENKGLLLEARQQEDGEYCLS